MGQQIGLAGGREPGHRFFHGNDSFGQPDNEMDTKLDILLKKIKLLEDQLLDEIHAKEQQFRYEIRKRKVHFKVGVAEQHKRLAKTIRQYLCDAKLLSIITGPVIWSCIVPVIFLDVWVTVYQFICFPAYGIPKVRRRDYIVMA